MAVENAAAIGRLLAKEGEGPKLVAEIVKISTEGRAAKQGPTLFAYAMCARLGDVETRRAVYKSLTAVCRIPTHLFMFVAAVVRMEAPNLNSCIISTEFFTMCSDNPSTYTPPVKQTR